MFEKVGFLLSTLQCPDFPHTCIGTGTSKQHPHQHGHHLASCLTTHTMPQSSYSLLHHKEQQNGGFSR